MGARFFALVIGINEYPGLRRGNKDNDLGGACNDACNICEWLIQYVLPGTDNSHITLQDLLERKSNDNITLLLDKQATREGIIKNITALSNNDNIQQGDPILIYYAGHGSVAMSHPNWHHAAKGGDNQSAGRSLIEVLLPHDVYTPCEAPLDQQVQPIPDTTMKRLMRELAQKSDNITVILDCCHSAGIMRSDSDEDLGKSRVTKLEELFGKAPVLPDELDDDIMLRTKDLVVKGGDQASHVLLAACGDQETAREDHPGSGERQGCFTRAFLKEVKNTSRNNISYADLIEEFPQLTNWKGDELKQHPHCIGAWQDRILFNVKLPPRDPDFIRIHVQPPTETIVEAATYTLHSGVADGIVQGSKFTVHRTCLYSDKDILCTMRVTEIQPFSATLVPDDPKPVRLPKSIYGKQDGWTEQQALRILCTKKFRQALDHGILKLHSTGRRFDPKTGLSFVHTKQDAMLVLGIEKGNVVFDYRLPANPFFRLPVKAGATHKELLPILSRAVRWNWDLTRGIPCPTEEVTLEFTGLREIETGFRAGELEPDGNNLNNNGAVVNRGEYYGFTLTNRLKTDLQVKIFWFDATLEVSPIYRGATGIKQQVDPTLRGNLGIFPVGYGASGVPSLVFWEVSEGDTPFGFIRVFIQNRNTPPEPNKSSKSTETTETFKTPLDFSVTSFKYIELPKSPPSRIKFITKPTDVAKDKSQWYTITLPIIVK